jgi:S1-C subfamily serine protease/outer membrane biosynthesis protein TonB
VSHSLVRFVRTVTLAALALASDHVRALSPEQVFELAGTSIVKIAVLDAQGAPIRQGSGVVVRPGEIVASCNVVAGEARALVVFRGTKWALAELAGTSPQLNLCYLKWRGEEAIGEPVKGIVAIDKVRKGQVAYAVGSPRGLELALSSSIVSGFRRHPDRGMVIETDTPIAPEASGGGLFDREGRLIGFTAVVLGEDRKLDFAVPASGAFELVPGLRTRRIVPLALSANEERVDRDHHARLQAEAARVPEARRFLEAERARFDRERVLAEEERSKAAAQAQAQPAPVSPEPAKQPVVVVETEAPPKPAPTAVALEVVAERVEKALAGGKLPAKVYSLDLEMALGPDGRVTKLAVDRSSGDKAVDSAVNARISKAGPYRDPTGSAADGPVTISLRVGWFHDHAAVIPMIGALPPFGAPSGRAATSVATGPSLTQSPASNPEPQPDVNAEREARELAAKQQREAEEERAQKLRAAEEERAQKLRAAEEERALRRRAEAEQMLQAKADEQRINRETAETEGRVAVAAAATAQRIVADYTSRVGDAIGAQFLIPPSATADTRAEIEFRVMPNGQVSGLRFVRKSGNAAFDVAIENAVERARPLPVPTDPVAYQQFRDQRLVFSGAR